MNARFEKGARALVVALIWGYQKVVSPLFPPRCRFVPSCSRYAVEAVQVHGVIAGGWLSVKRLARCQPLARSGFDPVPPKGR